MYNYYAMLRTHMTHPHYKIVANTHIGRKRNQSRAQGERHSLNYKRKFDFKCKKIITHKCSFYII